MNSKTTACLALAGSLLTGRGHASVFMAGETLASGNVVQDAPHAGLSRTLNVSSPGNAMVSLSVTLDISSAVGDTAWNGDLYVQLTSPQGGLAVLLNQTGVSSTDPAGYGDAGFKLTIRDTAAHDAHLYQASAPVFNPAGQLTGSWQSDGRTDPASAARTKKLENLLGENPNGTWVLLVVDRSGGNLAQLNGWEIAGFDVAVVPEPVSTTAVSAALLAGFAWVRRRKA